MEAPAIINRHRRPFLLPVWLSFAALCAVFLVAVVAFFVFHSATTTVVVIVRDAEQEIGSIQDPPLSAEGERRAQRLAQMFGPAKGIGHLEAIYVNDSRQSQQTANPLAERLAKQPVAVSAADVKAIAERILREHSGGTVLVVSHNTVIPALIRQLADIDVSPIPSDDYDSLYILSIPTFGDASLLRMQY